MGAFWPMPVTVTLVLMRHPLFRSNFAPLPFGEARELLISGCPFGRVTLSAREQEHELIAK